MHKIYIRHGGQNANLLVNAVIVIVGAMLIAASLVLGFFAFLALSAIILVVALVSGLRNWWANRRSPKRTSDVIEGEFHVVKRNKSS